MSSHSFMYYLTDCKGGARESSPTAFLRSRDNQYPRRGPGKMEAQVCLLDPGTSRRRQGDREGSLGRGDRELRTRLVGEGSMDEGRAICRGGKAPVSSSSQQLQQQQMYVEDLHRNGNTQDEDCGWSGYYLYDRCGETALGLSQDEDEKDIGHIDERRCFNCGLPGHMISSCPEPRNHALVALSRQLFYFFKGDNAPNGNQRVHEVEGWQQQRLEWLETFEPGQIRGSLLRDALGLEDGDAGENVEWLRNMCIWGYPKGWYASVDPRERIWNMLSGGDDGDDSEYAIDDFMFDIVGEDSVERLVLPSRITPHAQDTRSNASDSDFESDPELSSASSRSSTPSSRAQPAPQRWAAYPLTYFLWSRLPIYNGLSLPNLQSIRNAALQSSDARQPIFAQDSPLPKPPNREGRHHDESAALRSSVHECPPPPRTTPPPLPSAEAPVARYESQYPVEQYPPPPPPTVPPPPPPMMPPLAMLPATAPPTHHTALLSIPHSAPIQRVRSPQTIPHVPSITFAPPSPESEVRFA